MNFVGVDVGKQSHAVASVGAAGAAIGKPRMIQQDANGYALLAEHLEQIGGPSDVLVAMEATGHYWKTLRHDLSGRGYHVDVINPLITSREASADVRGRKTDKLDAVAIAQVARRGGYSSAPPEDADVDSLKSLVRQRQYLVERRTAAKLRYSSSLELLFAECRKAFRDIYTTTALALVERFPSARLLATADIRSITSTARKASGINSMRTFAEELKQAARCSVSLGILNTGEEFALTQLVAEIRSLEAQIKQVDQHITACKAPAAAHFLRSIKGAGAILPRIIASELGDLDRFRGPDMSSRILAFAGAEPRVRESGSWKGKTKMSKRGSRTLRHALYLMAGCVRLHNPFFQDIYQRQIAKGKHHRVAMSHVMRKIVEVLCGMYKSGSLFSPETETQKCS